MRRIAVLIVLALALFAPTACSTSCEQAAPTVAFDGTVDQVDANGTVTLTSVQVTSGTLPPEPVHVTFPKEQVDQLTRDRGQRYHVVAYRDASGKLGAELNAFDHPCGATRLADESK